MAKRRFFAFMVLMLLLFAAAFGSGCGSGGSGDLSSPGGGGDNPSDNPTPVPTPPEPTASVYVQYVIDHVAIGFQRGDNSEYVTKDVELPSIVENISGVTITWSSSNSDAISETGNVTRQAEDSPVTLTATASNGEESKSREFDLVVIRRRSRTIEEAKEQIEVIGVDEIRVLNASNDDFQISYSASRDRVTDVDGMYSSLLITNADDALDSIQSVHGIIGISDPYEELEHSIVTADDYGGEYTFDQVYEGVRVFGRQITASANSEGKSDFVTSNIVPSTTLNNADLNFAYTQEQAENIAKEYYIGDYEVRSDATEKIIFSLASFDKNPVPAYVVNINGIDDEGEYVDENLFVNALNGEVIYKTVNIYDASANDELGNPVTFPVDARVESDGTTYYYMYDPETKVSIFNEYATPDRLVRSDNEDSWPDAQQVSAYKNMIDIIKWWKSAFNRDSLNGAGMPVDVITHERQNNWRDNAFWWGYTAKIYVCDRLNNARSSAAAPDILAHESTHAVFEYRAGYLPYDGATGAINEGYADIFGCLMTEDWRHGLDVFADGAYGRNIANPSDPNSRQNIDTRITAPSHYNDRYTGDFDDHGVHINSSLVSYPAYRMRFYGISWEDLAAVWYRSMRMGYSATSDYYTVRRNVLRAARKMQMSDENIVKIKQAFNDVGIGEVQAQISGVITKYSDGTPLEGAEVNFTNVAETRMVASAVTGADGTYLFNLVPGRYEVTVSADGFLPLNALKRVEEGDELEMNVALVENGTGSISGTAKDAVTANNLAGVRIRLTEGWDVTDQYASTITTATNAYGYYQIDNVPAGYYTLEAYLANYTILTANLVIAPGVSLIQDALLSPADLDGYRVTLQWDANPRDLDSHLIGHLPDGNGTFHVYFVNKTAYDSDGNLIANLDHDDTQGNGFETTTFIMQPGDTFKYYVHWYAGDGTWAGSNAVVKLYKGAQLIGTFPVPDVDSHGDESGRYWHVFDLTSGLDPVEPATADKLVITPPTL